MNKYISNCVYITQIYAETGVNFGEILHWRKLEDWEQTLKKNIVPEGVLLKKYLQYELGLIITSSTAISDLIIKGPRKGRKNKFLEYALWIPYASVVSDPHPLAKLTEYFKQGVAEVLRKLEYSEESIQKALEGINDKPVIVDEKIAIDERRETLMKMNELAGLPKEQGVEEDIKKMTKVDILRARGYLDSEIEKML